MLYFHYCPSLQLLCGLLLSRFFDTSVIVLRVIKKDLKPARHQEIDSDDDDDLLGIEETEESDEGEMGETIDSDEQTDNSEAVVGAPEAGKEVDGEDSNESDGGMDDDAMFRMDSYLAQIFRDRKDQAGSETAHSQLVLFTCMRFQVSNFQMKCIF